MRKRTVLLTGFEPYGGRGVNPAAEVTRRLNASSIAGAEVTGSVLPVSFAGLRERVRALVGQTRPAAMVCLGLWPGEPMIRLEQVGVNLADFEIPDNEGHLLTSAPVHAQGAPARFATLPLRAIQRRLLEAGIPTRLSSTAGTFLCNATLYSELEALEELGNGAPGGFVHLPYLPQQVALLVADVQEGRSLELGQRADLASMSLETMVDAVRIVIETTLSARA
jgi:pyroglutamyl-peptidase